MASSSQPLINYINASPQLPYQIPIEQVIANLKVCETCAWFKNTKQGPTCSVKFARACSG